MGPIIRCLTGHPSWKPFRNLVPVHDEADMLLCNTHIAPPEFGSSPALENRHLAMTTYGDELVGVAALRLVKEAARSSSRNGGGSDDWWGCEVLLFAVDAEYEGQASSSGSFKSYTTFARRTQCPSSSSSAHSRRSLWIALWMATGGCGSRPHREPR